MVLLMFVSVSVDLYKAIEKEKQFVRKWKQEVAPKYEHDEQLSPQTLNFNIYSFLSKNQCRNTKP